MLKPPPFQPKLQNGSSMIEVLMTLVILTFGLLGLAAFHMKMQAAEMESQQRLQAVSLLADIRDRIASNRAQATNYVMQDAVGTGDAQPASCTAITDRASRDICEWSNALKGAAERATAGNTGAMIGARGCITQVTAPNPAPGVCTPGSYRVSVAWQGVHKNATPGLSCAQGSYGNDDGFRRVIGSEVVIGFPDCV